MSADVAGLVERLEGVYRVPITDGLGAVGGGEEPDNPNEFVRRFPTVPIQLEAASTIRALVAENERLREDIATRTMNWLKNNVTDKGEILRAEIKAATAEAKLYEAVEVLWTLYHAACGPTGFAAAVRATSGVPYPWPALDEADDLARAFLATMEKPNDP